jgi:signal peptidase I
LFLSLSTELLQSGYGVRFRPIGQSMHPTIRDGETVTVEPVRATAIKRGDILLYQTARGLIAHRVVAILKKGEASLFVMRGDASQSCAETVEAGQVLGLVVRVEREKRAIELAGRRARLRQMARLRAARLKSALLPARRTEAI